MKGLAVRLKDKLYYYFAEKNWGVRREYGPYVDAHQEEHAKQPWKHRWMLVRLNWHYRVLRRTDALYYQEPTLRKGVKLPYLDGSESEGFKRRLAIHLAKELMNYDVISFDIFDTLILRPFSKPIDLFMVVGNKLGIMDFLNIRRDAEKEAREEAQVLSGTMEVNISDIYEKVAYRTGIDKETGIRTEFETELEFCFANPYMLQVFKMLREQSKRIIITSDMYFPQDMLQQILERCGYTGYEKIYVSCDYLCSKRTGGLYKNIVRDYKKCRIAHVGDNLNSDINSAEKVGIKSFYYKNCHEIGNRYRADGMSELIGSFYRGIVNTHLHNGARIYSPHYEFGFLYGGLYILGYCNWIHKKAKQEGIDKILFLSRDGYIYQKVFNMMFDDVPNEYVYWSRIITLKATIKVSRVDFLKRTVLNRANSAVTYSIREMLNAMSLSPLLPKFIEAGLKADTLVVPDVVEKVERVFIDNWSMLSDIYEDDRQSAAEYLKSIVQNCTKVAVVDVGWSGTNVLSIKRLIEEMLPAKCRVKCYIAACHGAPNYNIVEMMDETIESYMFSRFDNQALLNYHRNNNKGLNGSIFEFLSQANHPSFNSFSADGAFLFDVPEGTNYPINKEIQGGIIDFCSMYLRMASANKYLLNVSGHDAYCPFKFATLDLTLIKKLFQDYTCATIVGLDMKTKQIETFGDLLNKKHL